MPPPPLRLPPRPPLPSASHRCGHGWHAGRTTAVGCCHRRWPPLPRRTTQQQGCQIRHCRRRHWRRCRQCHLRRRRRRRRGRAAGPPAAGTVRVDRRKGETSARVVARRWRREGARGERAELRHADDEAQHSVLHNSSEQTLPSTHTYVAPRTQKRRQVLVVPCPKRFHSQPAWRTPAAEAADDAAAAAAAEPGRECGGACCGVALRAALLKRAVCTGE